MTAETQSLQATDDNPLLADLIDWSDEDGDLLTFGFTDLNSDAGSGSLVLNGVIQTAGQEIVVSEEQLLNGERSEEHTSELQSLMRISYAVFCLKKTKTSVASARTRVILESTTHKQ